MCESGPLPLARMPCRDPHMLTHAKRPLGRLTFFRAAAMVGVEKNLFHVVKSRCENIVRLGVGCCRTLARDFLTGLKVTATSTHRFQALKTSSLSVCRFSSRSAIPETLVEQKTLQRPVCPCAQVPRSLCPHVTMCLMPTSGLFHLYNLETWSCIIDRHRHGGNEEKSAP